MATKSSYGIRADLDRRSMDQEVPISTKTTNLMVVPIKTILGVVGAAFLLIGIVRTTSFAKGNLFITILFCLVWLLAAVWLFSVDRTREMRVSRVMALWSYLNPSSRKIMTRSSSNPNGMHNLVRISKIEEDHLGVLLYFSDNTFGRAFRVVGSASLLLFPADQEEIVNRVDAFWRKVTPASLWTFITAKEPQRYNAQVHAISLRRERRQQADGFDHPDLQALEQDHAMKLVEHVGRHYKTIQQHLLIKAPSLEELNENVITFLSEAENASPARVFKRYSRMNEDDVVSMLKPIYSGR